MKLVVVIACAMITASCVIHHTPKPYEGIQKNSYGNLSDITLKACDENLSPSELTKSGFGVMFEQINGLLVYDDILVKEDLQDQFRLPADSGYATVAVISRNEEEIVFWYTMSAVSLFEVKNAAQKYCGRENKNAIYEGSAQTCGKPEKNFPKLLKQSPDYLIPTFVISGFSCK